jgi:hypothetical protein
VIDEAQAIGDKKRGEVLRSSVRKLLERNPKIQIIFGSTLLSNPEEFGKIFSLDKLAVCGSRLSTYPSRLACSQAMIPQAKWSMAS